MDFFYCVLCSVFMLTIGAKNIFYLPQITNCLTQLFPPTQTLNDFLRPTTQLIESVRLTVYLHDFRTSEFKITLTARMDFKLEYISDII